LQSPVFLLNSRRPLFYVELVPWCQTLSRDGGLGKTSPRRKPTYRRVRSLVCFGRSQNPRSRLFAEANTDRSFLGCAATVGSDPPHRVALGPALQPAGTENCPRNRGSTVNLHPGTSPDPPWPKLVLWFSGVGLAAAPLFELWGEFAEFLQYYSSIRLCIFCSPTGVGLGYGRAGGIQRYFLSSARFLLRAKVCLPEQLTAGRPPRR